jgi:hypothetical protein
VPLPSREEDIVCERSDGEFLEAFESGALPASEFHHRDHVRMAWLYVSRLGAPAAAERVLETLWRFAAGQGAAQIFHVTLTHAWVQLVGAALAGGPPDESFPAFLERNPHLLDKALPQRHYAPETLASAKAKERFVPPDRAALP